MDGLYRWDMATFRAINAGWNSSLLTPLFFVLSYTGLSQIQILFTLALYRWPETRRFIVPIITTIAFTGLAFAQGIKKLLPRDRPSNLRESVVFENFYGHNSFVSGHTTTAFAMAVMILLMTVGTRQARWGLWAMVWAFGVGISRVYRGVHWPSDALAGGCAGAFGSAIIYLWFSRKGWLDLTLESWSRSRRARADQS